MGELKKHQRAMTIEEQINNLKDIGLVVADEDYARKVLNDISYFRLIKAYSLNLKPRNGTYLEGITFERIVELYLFNANFRQSLLSIIEKVEINLRCRIANYFGVKYGVTGYLCEENFANAEYYRAFREDIEKEIDRNSKSPFVSNFRDNYEGGELPIYAVVELFSFGTLSKFYKNMKNPDKKNVAVSFNVGYTYLESWIENLAYVRNICAHYGRLYNARMNKSLILYKEYTDAKIGNQRIFATLLCLKHILKGDRKWDLFVQDLANMFRKYEHVEIETMGFPENWRDYLEQAEN